MSRALDNPEKLKPCCPEIKDKERRGLLDLLSYKPHLWGSDWHNNICQL